MPVGVGVIGCGTISHEYLRNLARFPDVAVHACADLDVERAKAAAEKYAVPAAGAPDTVLEHPDVEIVVNLTVPAAHVEVAASAIAAGKHVYSEKPIALDPVNGARLLADARAAGVRIGAAPDTFLGAGLQSAYRLVAQGAIGTPLSAVTLMQGPGPQSWHPAPEFYFSAGGGPLFDMGPYYLTALAAMFGPVTRVVATTRTGFAERTIGSGPRAGTRFPVRTPTHVSALLDFASGPAGSTIFSFDSPLTRQDFVEITGTEATLAMPSPNAFTGPSRLRRAGEKDWTVVAETGSAVGRGVGVLDMARAIRAGRPHRTGGAGALHVVEVLAAILESAGRGEFMPVASAFAVPEPLPLDWDPFARTVD
jgi:predicted dehydrogenase